MFTKLLAITFKWSPCCKLELIYKRFVFSRMIQYSVSQIPNFLPFFKIVRFTYIMLLLQNTPIEHQTKVDYKQNPNLNPNPNSKF